MDEFIYRISVLSSNNLNGNFDLLCRHAHSLFEGKTLERYWRYHRHNNDLDWVALSTALRDRYKDYFTDFDVIEEIHRRKQRNSETFDDFLKLRTEIRHELLHLDITTISRFR